jgi:hypothetical protein
MKPSFEVAIEQLLSERLPLLPTASPNAQRQADVDILPVGSIGRGHEAISTVAVHDDVGLVASARLLQLRN